MGIVKNTYRHEYQFNDLKPALWDAFKTLIKALIIVMVSFFAFSAKSQSDTTIVIDFSESFIVDGFSYDSAECRVDVLGGGLYSISYKVIGVDSVNGQSVPRTNTLRQYENISGAVALAVLDQIYDDLDSKATAIQGRYNRVNALRTRYIAQYQDIQGVRDAFSTLKTWAQSQ